MEKNFNHNVVKLQKEINSISNGINKVRFKNHRTMSNIVEKLKNISKKIIIYHNISEEHKLNCNALKNGKKQNDVLFSYKKRTNSDKKHKSNHSVKYSLKGQEIQNCPIPGQPFTPNNYNNNIQKLIKSLKNNEDNDDDILLSENNVINRVSDDFKKLIFTEKINFNKKRKRTKNNKKNFSDNNAKIINNISDTDNKNKRNYNNNLNAIKTINNYCNPSHYYNKTNINNYLDNNMGQKTENNSFRFKILNNIRDEIEDIKFKDEVKNINQDNFINNNNKLYIQNETISSSIKNNNYNFPSNQKVNNIKEYLIKNSNYNEKAKRKNNIFLYKNKCNRKKNNKTKSTDMYYLDRKINNNYYDNKTFFKFCEDSDNNKKIININNDNRNKKYIINDHKTIKEIDFEDKKNSDDDYFNKDINNEILTKTKDNFIQEKNNHYNCKNKIYTKTISKIYLNKNSLIIKNLLKYKEKKNLDDLMNWIRYVKQYQTFVSTLMNVYNNCNYNYNNNNNNKNFYNNILSWIKETIEKKQRINIYENYCKNIINTNNLKNIEEFKFFMNKILNKNKQNKQFLQGMKKIFQDNFDPKIINVISEKNANDIYYKTNFLFNK